MHRLYPKILTPDTAHTAVGILLMPTLGQSNTFQEEKKLRNPFP